MIAKSGKNPQSQRKQLIAELAAAIVIALLILFMFGPIVDPPARAHQNLDDVGCSSQAAQGQFAPVPMSGIDFGAEWSPVLKHSDDCPH